MPRVLAIGSMYPPQYLGGAELVWHSAMCWLRDRGYAVRVLTTDFHVADNAEEWDPDVYRELRWYWRDHEVPAIGQLARLRLERHNRAVLRRHLRGFRPDVVMWWALGAMSLSLIEQVRRAGIPALGHVGDDWLEYGPYSDAWSRAWSKRPSGRVVGLIARVPTRLEPGRAAFWHFNSQRTLDRARELGWDLPRVRVTPPGIDPELFLPHPPEDWRWRLLYVGRIDRRKGTSTAVEAIARLPEAATLDIVGAGDWRHESEIRSSVQCLGLEERVRLCGPTEHSLLPTVYAAADAVLFPVEWEEPWGLVPLEAMGVGRPVVATGTGGSREYLRDGENCLLFERGDADSLATAVRRLANDPSLRERLRTGGAETAARYTEAACNAALEHSIEELLSIRKISRRDARHGEPRIRPEISS